MPVEIFISVRNVALSNAVRVHLNRTQTIGVRAQIVVRSAKAELISQCRYGLPITRAIWSKAVDRHVGLFNTGGQCCALGI